MRNRSQRTLAAGIGGLSLGVGLGVAVMYLLDADSGRRRRALARDRAAHALRRGGRGLKAATRHLSQQARGLAFGARARLRRVEEVPDTVLQERVRAVLGHATTHPAGIEVEAAGGHVTLSGPVLAREARRVLRKVRRVPGVQAVASRLERLDRFEPLAAVRPDGGALRAH
jgi:hypothetical protein